MWRTSLSVLILVRLQRLASNFLVTNDGAVIAAYFSDAEISVSKEGHQKAGIILVRSQLKYLPKSKIQKSVMFITKELQTTSYRIW